MVNKSSKQHSLKKIGSGIINSLINKLPFEAHIPGYQYCGPGTNLKKRLKRGDSGINGLDTACKSHDIAYSTQKSLQDIHKADKLLEESAWERVKAKDSKFSEKAAAWAVTTAMKVKRKLGMGVSKRKHRNRKPTHKKKRIFWKEVILHYLLQKLLCKMLVVNVM